jgi:Asp-tRNA(Asn)/Glu-tRNA(Gln) amidotransferase A subunit family amidase
MTDPRSNPPKGAVVRPILLISTFISLVLVLAGCGEKIPADRVPDDEDLRGAARVAGLDLTESERQLMMADLAENVAGYDQIRGMKMANDLRPALRFDPELVTGPPAEMSDPASEWSAPGTVVLPANPGDLAFYTVAELGALIRTRQISCEKLTRFTLARFRKHDPQLMCTVTLLEDRALSRARELDAMLDEGRYLGSLHGIPYGAKDLLAVEGAPTTWGSEPYRDQVIDATATLVQKLDEAGAILVAKLTLGALAWGDVWFGGMTRNPWNLEQGSSGSSAGSASAVAAGLVPFAIGTETWGSIVSPSTRCGTTGIRPTFGRVSKAGAMALSWTMDKIGPIARHAEDCAMVLDVIRGSDPGDPTAVDRPFGYRPEVDLAGLRIGYLARDFIEEYPGAELDQEALDVLRSLGAELVALELPLEEWGLDPYAMSTILSVEAAAAFQELTLSGRDDLLTRQVRYAWPNVFRGAHFVSAVEYVQANRARLELMKMMAEVFEEFDLYVTPSLYSNSLLITNLTGHPQVVMPAGFIEENQPHSISLVGDLWSEATLLAVARAYQEATGWDEMRPEGF